MKGVALMPEARHGCLVEINEEVIPVVPFRLLPGQLLFQR